MRQVILVFAVLAVIAIAVIAFTGPGDTRVWMRPLIGIVHGANGLIYQVKDSDYALVVSLPKDWQEQSQGNSSGGKTYNASAAFVCRRSRNGLRPQATILRSSSNSWIASINGVSYDLSQGSVFRIRMAKPAESEEDVSNYKSSDSVNSPSAGVEVIQLPFAPLDVTPTYVEELNEYLKARGLD